jgi:hypothetical protein
VDDLLEVARGAFVAVWRIFPEVVASIAVELWEGRLEGRPRERRR